MEAIDRTTLIPLDVVLSGRLITAVDASLIPTDCFQTLKNLRYGLATPSGVSGMTAMNPTVLSQLEIDSAIHFRKESTGESHILVHAFDGTSANGKVYKNSTAIGSSGNFDASALWTDDSAAVRNRFAIVPDDAVVWCNRRENIIYDGTESRIGAFINHDPSDFTKLWDYTERLSDVTSTSADATTLHISTNTIDSDTKLLLHLDNASTDSSAGAHTMTANNLTYTPVGSWPLKGASYSGVFNGASSNVTAAAHADFDLSGGVFTIDTWVYITDFSANRTIMFQATDANNYVHFATDINRNLQFTIVAGGLPVVNLTGPAGTYNTNTWYHLAVVENGNNWYMFINGRLVASISDASRAANYTGLLCVGGSATTGTWFYGQIMEFRISKGIARWTSSFALPQYKLGTTDNAHIMIGSIRPISGLKLYVGTANTNTGTTDAYYWTGTGWSAVSSLSDGTLSGGKTLAQTGTITFTDTSSVAYPTLFNGTVAYWYKFAFGNISATTSLYRATLQRSAQAVKDIWDGEFRQIVNLNTQVSGVINDVTKNVIFDEWAYGDEATYVNIGGLAASTDALYFGFTEQMTGLKIKLVKDNPNTTALTLATVYYWNGSDWAIAEALQDATLANNISFGKSGTMFWQTISSSAEEKRVINDDTQISLYYYKVVFNQTLSANTYLYHCAGIAAPLSIKRYVFPLMWQNRMLLCNNLAHGPNKVLIGAQGTNCVFNGVDSVEREVGDSSTGLVAGGSLYQKIGDTILEALVLAKVHSTYLMTGTSPADFKIDEISGVFGCVAPETFRNCDLGYEVGGLGKHILIWQAAGAVVMFDGNSITSVSEDIKNFFDPNSSDHMNFAHSNESVGFYDTQYKEYHWLFSSGTNTTLDREFVFDVIKKEWFEIDRSTKKLLYGFSVTNTYDNHMAYGISQDGYVERLESGTTFDGVPITYTLKTSDRMLPVGGGSPISTSYVTQIRYINLLMKTKSTTSESVTVSHFSDSSSTADTDSVTIACSNSGFRLAGVRAPQPVAWDAISHALQLSITTNNETIGFEPIGITLLIKAIRQNLK